jgi:hypothetical protein
MCITSLKAFFEFFRFLSGRSLVLIRFVSLYPPKRLEIARSSLDKSLEPILHVASSRRSERGGPFELELDLARLS